MNRIRLWWLSGGIWSGSKEKAWLAIKKLGNSRDDRAVVPLMEVFTVFDNWSVNRDIQMEAARALMRLGKASKLIEEMERSRCEGAVMVLRAVLNENKEGGSYDRAVQDDITSIAKKAAEAILKISGVTTLLPLGPHNTLGDSISTLEAILKYAAANVKLSDLRSISELNDYKYSYSAPSHCSGNWAGTKCFSCSQVRQLARQELIRRGYQA